MASKDKLTIFFNEIDKHDISQVGGKGANLGEMTKAGFPVPFGFAVTVASYDIFLEENNLRSEIRDILKGLDRNNAEDLMRASQRIERRILNRKVPESVAFDVIKSYIKLSGGFKKALVAVRSSATAEDLPGASFAGQQATLLNIKGEASLLEAIKECWASLFTARAIFYRGENKISEDKVGISVIIQKMIQSEVSGVMFSIDPVTNDKERIIIESVWGLGELIVQGSVLPDSYAVQKGTYSILSKLISDQNVQLIRKGQKTLEQKVPKSWLDRQKITNEEIIALAKLAQKLQEHYYFPQDIEWAKEKNKLYIVQTRPITTMGMTKKQIGLDNEFKKIGKTAVIGCGSAPGITNILVFYGSKFLRNVNSVEIFFADKDKTKYNQNFVLPYSFKTIVDEYTLKPAVLSNGKIRFVKPMSGLKEYSFDKDYGKKQGFLALHSELATLPEFLRNKGVKAMEFRVTFDKKFNETIKTLINLGFASQDNLEPGNNLRISDITSFIMDRFVVKPGTKVNDEETLRVVFNDGKLVMDAVARSKYNIPAGTYNTGVPCSVIAQMIARRTVKIPGVHAPEKVINPTHFFKELKKRGITVLKNGRKVN